MLYPLAKQIRAGESFDDYSKVVVNVRDKGDKIAKWITKCEYGEAITYIGRVHQERLGLPPKIMTGY